MTTKGINQLSIFIGSWRTTGTIASVDGGEPSKLIASDIYEWFQGEHFIVHHVDGSMGNTPVRAMEILRYDDENGFITQSIDDGGQYSEYEAQLDGRKWQIRGSTERFEGTFNGDYTELQGQWFTLKEGEPDKPWMQIELKKEPD